MGSPECAVKNLSGSLKINPASNVLAIRVDYTKYNRGVQCVI